MRIGFIGAGKLAAAIAQGVIRAGVATSDEVIGSARTTKRRDWFAREVGVRVTEDNSVVVGYGVVQTLMQVLTQCGDNLTRENVMKQAASLKDFRTEMLLPGIKINTSANDFAPISQLQLQRFKGDRWELFGDVISADVGG